MKAIQPFFILALLCVCSVKTNAFQAIEPLNDTQLSTPRRAIHAFVHWQQQGHKNYENVILPFKNAEGNKESRIELAKQLLRVLDAKGLLVEYEKIPDNPVYVDSLSGLSQYILFKQLPEVYVTKIGNEWVFSEATINQIPSLYRSTFSSFIASLVDQLPTWTETNWLGIAFWQYIAVFFWILIGLFFKNIFEFVLDNYIRKITQKTTFTWDVWTLDHSMILCPRH